MRDENIDRRNTQIPSGLHPRVYQAMVALAVWFVVVSWIGFGDASYIDYLLVVMTGFVAMAVILPLIAGHEWHRFRTWTPPHTDDFDEWLAGELQVDQSRMPARTAMFLLLMPLAAAAVSMTAFAIVAIALS